MAGFSGNPIATIKKLATIISVVEIQSQLNVKRFPTTQQATLGTSIFFFQIGKGVPTQPATLGSTGPISFRAGLSIGFG